MFSGAKSTLLAIVTKNIREFKLTIKDNILKYKDSVIQISNIAHCEIAPEPKKTYPLWVFAGLIIGALMLFNKSLIAIGIALLVICGSILYVIFSENANLYTYLILELNSGKIILFSSKEKNFLWKAQNEIIKCFNNKKQGCVINFSDCTITHSQIGKNNLMNNNEAQNGD